MGTGTIIGLSILGGILLFLAFGINILEEEIGKEKSSHNEDKFKNE
jgi:hypothetical protein